MTSNIPKYLMPHEYFMRLNDVIYKYIYTHTADTIIILKL